MRDEWRWGLRRDVSCLCLSLFFAITAVGGRWQRECARLELSWGCPLSPFFILPSYSQQARSLFPAGRSDGPLPAFVCALSLAALIYGGRLDALAFCRASVAFHTFFLIFNFDCFLFFFFALLCFVFVFFWYYFCLFFVSVTVSGSVSVSARV